MENDAFPDASQAVLDVDVTLPPGGSPVPLSESQVDISSSGYIGPDETDSAPTLPPSLPTEDDASPRASDAQPADTRFLRWNSPTRSFESANVRGRGRFLTNLSGVAQPQGKYMKDRTYIRYIFLPLVCLLVCLAGIPLARMSFVIDSNAKWYEACFWALVYMSSTMMILLVYRAAFLDPDIGSPFMPLDEFKTLTLVCAGFNGMLAFLQKLYLPDDVTQAYDPDKVTVAFWLTDSAVHVIQLCVFFLFLPFIHYSHARKCLEQLQSEATSDPTGYLRTRSRMRAASHAEAVHHVEMRGASEQVDMNELQPQPAATDSATEMLQTIPPKMWYKSYMTGFVVVFIVYTFCAVTLERHEVQIYFMAPVIMTMWFLVLRYDGRDTSRTHVRSPAYLVMVAFSTIAMPTAGSRVMYDLIQRYQNEPGLQFLVIFVWNLLVIFVSTMLGKTIAICFDAKRGQAFAFLWAIKLFDDLFVSLAFLQVGVYGPLFFCLLIWQVIRDFSRDVGLHGDFLMWLDELMGTEVTITQRIVALCQQMRVADQNLTSEVISVMLIPAAVGIDSLMESMNLGVASITVHRKGNTPGNLVAGYGILMCVQLLTHKLTLKALDWKRERLVMRVLKEADSDARPQVDRQKGAGGAMNTARTSLTTQFWRIETEMHKHWRRQLMFFVAVMVYAGLQAIWIVTELRYRDIR